jgi:uncharacterized membrane protein YgaE (UPF0421/DUF939 family)
MTFIQKYNAQLKRSPSNRVTLHLIGRELVAVAIGVFFARYLTQFGGIMLIVGILLMLPVLAAALKEHHGFMKATKHKKRKR